MGEDKSFEVSRGDDGINVDVQGQKFRFKRDDDELLIEAFDDDSPVEVCGRHLA